jgi:hypothetical protein
VRIRRNGKCPCGSGQKFKYCCGAPTIEQRRTPPVGLDRVSPEVFEKFWENQRKEAERVRQFGHGRPIISWEDHGYRIVAVGKTIKWSRKWKTVQDFLCDYIKVTIGPDWGNAELKKPFDLRHPIIQWYYSVYDLQHRTIKEPGKVYEAIATGPVRAYLSLAYDLYTLEHNSLLHKKMVERLKVRDQFQGVRYEIAAAATFIRAGFEIELEDEDDSTTSHCEFSATHRDTGAKFSVEAKSRSRPGVLGKAGTPRPVDEVRADVYRLVQDALKKRARHDRIVFIDVNMPPVNGHAYPSKWFDTIAAQFKRLEQSQSTSDPWPPAFIFLTNHPYHYAGNEDPAPGSATIMTAINMPDFKREVRGAEAMAVLAKYPAVGAVLNSSIEHTQVPHDFN